MKIFCVNVKETLNNDIASDPYLPHGGLHNACVKLLVGNLVNLRHIRITGNAAFRPQGFP